MITESIVDNDKMKAKINTMIEGKVADKHISYMEATLECSELLQIEPEFIADFLSKPIKEKIASEAVDKNLYKTTAKLKF